MVFIIPIALFTTLGITLLITGNPLIAFIAMFAIGAGLALWIDYG